MAYDNILVATDGSESANEIVEEAVAVAGQYGATIHGVYVINTGAIPSPDVQFREEYVERGEKLGADALETIEDAAAAAGIQATTTIRRGTPHEEILEYARENDVGLVVLGTHGRGGLSHALLGSVAERVIRKADRPVLVVPGSERAAGGD